MQIVGLIIISLVSLSIEIPKGENWYRSKIVVGVDGSLQKFLINDNEVVIPKIEETSESWKKPLTLNYALFPGDEIKFVMKSDPNIKHSYSETPNFAARIEYEDQRGNSAVFYSNVRTWDCNGDDPKSSGIIGENLAYAYWRIAELGDKAELLWSRNNQEATCYFKIPANLLTTSLQFKPVEKNESEENLTEENENEENKQTST